MEFVIASLSNNYALSPPLKKKVSLISEPENSSQCETSYFWNDGFQYSDCFKFLVLIYISKNLLLLSYLPRILNFCLLRVLEIFRRIFKSPLGIKLSQEAKYGISNTEEKTCIKNFFDRENSRFDYLSAVKRPGIKNKSRIYGNNNKDSCKSFFKLTSKYSSFNSKAK